MDRILEQWARERPDLDTEAMGIFGGILRIAKTAGDASAATYARFGTVPWSPRLPGGSCSPRA